MRSLVLGAQLEALRATLLRSDQAGWVGRLDVVERELETDGAGGARAALALFEPPDSLDELVLTYGGRVYVVDDDRLWDFNRDFGEARSALYGAALALWLEVRTGSPLADQNGQAAQKLADYGYGSEVWRIGKRYTARRDVGAHQSLWREDEISPAEAEQAALGSTHFFRMCVELEVQLRAAGIDPYAGSPTPLPNPG